MSKKTNDMIMPLMCAIGCFYGLSYFNIVLKVCFERLFFHACLVLLSLCAYPVLPSCGTMPSFTHGHTLRQALL